MTHDCDKRHTCLDNCANPCVFIFSQSLNDKGYHKIFDAIFQFVTDERAAFLKAARAATRTAHGTRLSNGAAALRLVLEVGVGRLRTKTVNALIEHITEALPLSEGGFCEHLEDAYPKCLRTLLSHAPHVEHLGEAAWQDLVDFCLGGIEPTDVVDDSQVSSRISTRFRSETPDASIRATPNRPLGRQDSRASRQGTKDGSDELMFCLQLLVSCPSAPVISRAKPVFDALIHFLTRSNAISRSHPAAFVTFNAVLTRTMTERLDLAHSYMVLILPIIKRLWTSKSVQLKDQLLITLLCGLRLFRSKSASQTLEENTILVLESLIEILQADYCKRQDRDSLQLDDLHLFPCNGLQGQPLMPRTANSKVEQNWAHVLILGTLATICDDQVEIEDAEVDPQDDLIRSKKQRRLSRLEDLVRMTSAPTVANRILALQVVALLNAHDSIPGSLIADYAESWTALMLDDNHNVASWAMVVVSRLVDFLKAVGYARDF